ncbi:MAG: PilZ domain-containing protein [Candidatus Omnitrophica bacterium]|nr:PilZ domain-containing protein [Candidatus Omnitrophota bacterium]MDD5238618.1 PilZ domain-containing protein [Candidatus Omnitrophota bacterium]
MPDFESGDRRIFERFRSRFSLKYINLNSSKEGLGHTNDVCANGLCINVQEKLSNHNLLEIWLLLPNRNQPLYTRAEVIWSAMTGRKDYTVGLKLEKPDLMELSRVLKVTSALPDNHP